LLSLRGLTAADEDVPEVGHCLWIRIGSGGPIELLGLLSPILLVPQEPKVICRQAMACLVRLHIPALRFRNIASISKHICEV